MGEFVLKQLDRKEIGRRVSVRRNYLGLSRENLAGMINVSPQFVADIEYGNKGMSTNTLFSMSQALRISADYLLAGKAEQKQEDAALQFREEINAMLDHLSKSQLKDVSDLIRIYEGRKAEE